MEDQLLKWLNGEINEDELRKTIDPADVLKYKQILGEVDRWVPDNDSLVFDPKDVTGQPKQTKTRSLHPMVPVSIAASILLVISALLWLTVFTDKSSYSTGVAEVREITLPDGLSKVTLAPNTEVSWREEDWTSNQRKINLTGKAFFQVEKGSPFEVLASTGKVEVLGTNFEVDVFSKSMNVLCFEGKVRATALDGQAIVVEGGEGRLYHLGEWEATILTENDQPSWLGSETKFKKAPLIQVIKSLEKQYGLEVIPGSVNLERRFTGSFPNEQLDVALRIVFDPLDISYKKQGNKLYLSE